MKIIENTVLAVFTSILIGSVLALALALSAFIPQQPKVDGLALYLPEIATIARDRAAASPAAPSPVPLLNYLTN